MRPTYQVSSRRLSLCSEICGEKAARAANGKVAIRNMFYDEQGRHVRTKKEILDGDGTAQAERAERKRKEAGRDYRARQNDKGAR
ncbi:MAG: hypothetical protein K2K74_12880 [Lachnospiraceae bacterium]|nr:hypothetical protein [Lachnospiraceae bacterium]